VKLPPCGRAAAFLLLLLLALGLALLVGWLGLRRLLPPFSGVETPLAPDLTASTHLAFYLLEKDLNAAEAARWHPGALALQRTPLLTLDDILRYDPQKAELTLTQSAARRLVVLTVPVSGLPFVVTLAGRPCCLGAFWTSLSSLSFDQAVVIDLLLVGQEGTLRLDLGYPASSEFFRGFDWRRDPDFLKLFEDAGLLAQP
jgi:hypothetical protein